ncbi:MAG: hypothetical protein AD742_21435 [Methylibium sp. NZG]|nr:MAG: hypothetical protein AD742_21435 [Methylibium sp. NZG]
MYYETGDPSDTVVTVALRYGTDTVAIVRVQGSDGPAWLRGRGVTDAKLNYLGRHRDDIVGALGPPSEQDDERLKYSSKEGKVDVEFSCPRQIGFACDTLEVWWHR